MIDQLSEIDDQELLLLISRSDRHAFSILYNRYGNNLMRFISGLGFSKEVAEEIVQDLFLKIWMQREDIIHITAIKPYLYPVLTRHCLHYLT